MGKTLIISSEVVNKILDELLCHPPLARGGKFHGAKALQWRGQGSEEDVALDTKGLQIGCEEKTDNANKRAAEAEQHFLVPIPHE